MLADRVPEHPVLTTERLRLRAFDLPDGADVQRLAGERAVAATTLTIPHPYPEGAAEEWIETHEPAFEKGEAISLAITLRDTSTLVGAIRLHMTGKHSRAELGYWIGVPYWGRGYATEAARAVVGYGFEKLDLNRIHACHFTGNEQSGRVLQKVGMKLEGTMRQHTLKWGVMEDLVIYGIVRSEHDHSAGTSSKGI